MGKTKSKEFKIYSYQKTKWGKCMLSANCVNGIYCFQQAQTKTPLNIWSVCERPASTLHNHECEHLADRLMYGRPIKKIMHDKIVQCWHILCVKIKMMKTREQQMRARVSYKISCVWETS